MTKFENLLSNLSNENPYVIIISGDFNCRSSQRWEKENEKDEGKRFEPLVSDLGLHQLIGDLTHLMGDHKSCIDLILTDQPSIFIDSGVHPSRHVLCHHQIVYGRLSTNNPTPPPCIRRIWHYNRANIDAIGRSIEMYRWHASLNSIQCPNQKVYLLTELVYNACSNFIPNDLKTIWPCQAPWLTKIMKVFLRKKNRTYKSFVRSGWPIDRYDEIKHVISEGSKIVGKLSRNIFLRLEKLLLILILVARVTGGL